MGTVALWCGGCVVAKYWETWWVSPFRTGAADVQQCLGFAAPWTVSGFFRNLGSCLELVFSPQASTRAEAPLGRSGQQAKCPAHTGGTIMVCTGEFSPVALGELLQLPSAELAKVWAVVRRCKESQILEPLGTDGRNLTLQKQFCISNEATDESFGPQGYLMATCCCCKKKVAVAC